jgi:spermidine/putrescine transport system ATP-binding protein
VADFIGESNLIKGVMHRDYDVTFAGRRFECVDTGFDPDQPVDVVIRPEDVKIVAPGEGQLRGRVNSVTFKGVFYEIFVDVGDIEFMIHSTTTPHAGDEVSLSLWPEDIHVMDCPDLFPGGAGAMTMEEIDPSPYGEGDEEDEPGERP